MAFSAQSPQRPLHPPDLLMHLRKLRHALTCSVCNQLYQKPASLHCNHHFCMSCIVQSLENISACPKCKQPASNRQARFSPEMDSLVDIFLSLESAARPVFVAKDSEDSQLENLLDVRHAPHNVKVEEECLSPSASKRQRRYESREQLSSNTKGAAEIDSRKRDASSMETPCRGILPASKRIQLPCPPVPSSTTEALGSSPAKKDTTNESPVKRKQPPRLGGQGRNLGAAPFSQGKPLLPTGIQGPNHEQEVSETTSGRTNENASFHSNNHVQEKNGMHAELLNKDLPGFPKQDVKMQAGSAHVQLADGKAQPNTVQIGFGAEKTCAFCHKSDSEVAGPMIQYKTGAPVTGIKKAGQTNQVHKNCAEWAPGVYYEDDAAKNIAQEVARGQKMKCFVCGLRGAVLGCYVKRCRKSFHYPCAHTLPCRWDEGNFLVFCPEHVASKFPDESLIKPGLKSVNVCNLDHAEEKPKQEVYANGYGHQSGAAASAPGDAYIPELLGEAQISQESPSKQRLSSKWVLCGSGLSPRANELMTTFANYSGLTVEKSWTPFVTHLIVGTDEVGAARRTFKYLMANLEGIWILKIDWLSACMAANNFVDEEPYEVNLDIHGMIGGPRRARAMSIAKVHRLFEDLTFCFLGEYAASFKADLQSLLTAGGGLVLTQMPDSSEIDSKTCIVLIYSKDMSVDTNASHREELNRSRCVEAKLLAGLSGSKVAGHTWILDSVAAYELQPFE